MSGRSRSAAAELQKQERRLQQKEENLDRKTENMEKKEEHSAAQARPSWTQQQEEVDTIKKTASWRCWSASPALPPRRPRTT